jgi:lipoprotein-releasing system permease protein
LKGGASFPLLLALRYLKSARRDAFVTFLSLVAALGIGLGVAALILSLAALSGFQRALRTEILARTPHLEVELPPGADEAAAVAILRTRAGVRAVTPVGRGPGWALSDGRAQAVEIFAFDGALPASFAALDRPADGLLLSAALAARWGLVEGDPVTLVSPRPTLTPLGPQPRARTLPLRATFPAGRTEQRERVGAPAAMVQTLLAAGDRRLEVEAAGLEAAIPLAPVLAAALPAGSRVRTWRELNRPLFFALRLEKTMMFLAVSLVILVAALALIAALALLIANKSEEIGVLGALGAAPAVLARAFLWLGGLIAGAGLVGGVGLGVGLATVLDRFQLARLPEAVYFLDHVPFLVRPADLLVIVGLTMVLSLGFSWSAAQRAASLDPIAAMRR